RDGAGQCRRVLHPCRSQVDATEPVDQALDEIDAMLEHDGGGAVDAESILETVDHATCQVLDGVPHPFRPGLDAFDQAIEKINADLNGLNREFLQFGDDGYAHLNDLLPSLLLQIIQPGNNGESHLDDKDRCFMPEFDQLNDHPHREGDDVRYRLVLHVIKPETDLDGHLQDEAWGCLSKAGNGHGSRDDERQNLRLCLYPQLLQMDQYVDEQAQDEARCFLCQVAEEFQRLPHECGDDEESAYRQPDEEAEGIADHIGNFLWGEVDKPINRLTDFFQAVVNQGTKAGEDVANGAAKGG